MNDVTICLTNPKSPSNVGAVFRACGCYDIKKMLYTGNRYNKAKRHAADTQNIFESIDIQHVEDFVSVKPDGVSLICVDFAKGATPLPEFKHPENAFYVFGPEDGSLAQEVIEQADHVVYMPTKGSLNLAAAVNVVLYDRAAKQFSGYDEQLIISSRDVNNRLNVG
jgi:tRNA(Leu) C34 or U34 (ribose-2'-O)-methylase TrmL